MKAAVLNEVKQDLKIEEKNQPIANAGEVVVKISAAAINHRDVYIQKGLYGKIQLPCILGSDGVGEVTETGDGVDPDWKGTRVVIDPTLNWGEMDDYQSRKFKILGMPDNGTFAEYVKVPAKNVYKAPEHLSNEEAAALPLAGVTAYRALFRQGGFKRGERVLITGIGGGVALMALKMAIAIDARVYVTSSETDKIEKAVELGAEGGVRYTNIDWNEKLKNNAGHFDLIIDGSAGKEFGKLVDVAAPGGRIVLYGGTAGTITDLSPQKVFWKQLTIKGSTMGNPEDFRTMLQVISEHKVKPAVDKVFPLKDVQSAFNRMDNGQQFGKIILDL